MLRFWCINHEFRTFSQREQPQSVPKYDPLDRVQIRWVFCEGIGLMPKLHSGRMGPGRELPQCS